MFCSNIQAQARPRQLTDSRLAKLLLTKILDAPDCRFPAVTHHRCLQLSSCPTAPTSPLPMNLILYTVVQPPAESRPLLFRRAQHMPTLIQEARTELTARTAL